MDKVSFLKKLGKKVTSLRADRNLSQSDLARLSDKDRQSIHRLEKGKINPSAIYLKEIADALDVELSELCDI